MVERAFANREQRIKAKKPVEAQAEPTAPPPPQQPKALDEKLSFVDEDDAAPCPAGDPPPGGRAESPCDFPAVERSVSFTDVSNRLQELHQKAGEVMRLTEAIRDAEYGDALSIADKATQEAARMLEMTEKWTNELSMQDEL